MRYNGGGYRGGFFFSLSIAATLGGLVATGLSAWKIFMFFSSFSRDGLDRDAESGI